MANKKPKGLGLGLEALLGPRVADGAATGLGEGKPRELKLDQLQAGKYQPRTQMDESSLQELAESIKSQGVMQPILVRPVSGQRFEIIAGERRYRAAALAGLTEVPVLVRDVSDETAAVMSLVENMQREDLNPLEEAQGLQRLVHEFGLTHDQAAQAVGRSRSAASNLLRLLKLTPPVQQLLMAGEIEMGHARALLSLEAAQQVMAAHEVASRKLNVRETETMVTRLSDGSRTSTARAAKAEHKSRDLSRLEEQLADRLGARVSIRIRRKSARGEQGEIAIGFGSLDELNGLLERLGAHDA